MTNLTLFFTSLTLGIFSALGYILVGARRGSALPLFLSSSICTSIGLFVICLAMKLQEESPLPLTKTIDDFMFYIFVPGGLLILAMVGMIGGGCSLFVGTLSDKRKGPLWPFLTGLITTLVMAFSLFLLPRL